MNVLTKAYGLVDVDEKQKISFPEGLFGFEELIDFVLFGAEQEPFFYLQALADKEVSFILIDPFLFRPDYETDIDNRELAAIGITAPEDALIFAIVTIPGNGGTITANLQGPLVIGKESRTGVQAVLSDPRWKTKHDIMAELGQLC
jgi:flagellar assembly factor FliW